MKSIFFIYTQGLRGPVPEIPMIYPYKGKENEGKT